MFASHLNLLAARPDLQAELDVIASDELRAVLEPAEKAERLPASELKRLHDYLVSELDDKGMLSLDQLKSTHLRQDLTMWEYEAAQVKVRRIRSQARSLVRLLQTSCNLEPNQDAAPVAPAPDQEPNQGSDLVTFSPSLVGRTGTNRHGERVRAIGSALDPSRVTVLPVPHIAGVSETFTPQVRHVVWDETSADQDQDDKRAAARAMRDAAASAQFPVGSRVQTVVRSIGGRSETITGEVKGYKRGELAVQTSCHGRIMVAPADALLLPALVSGHPGDVGHPMNTREAARALRKSEPWGVADLLRHILEAGPASANLLADLCTYGTDVEHGPTLRGMERAGLVEHYALEDHPSEARMWRLITPASEGPLSSGFGVTDGHQSTTTCRVSDFHKDQRIMAHVSLEHPPVVGTVWCVQGDAGIGWLLVRIDGRPTIDAYGTGEYVHIPADRCEPIGQDIITRAEDISRETGAEASDALARALYEQRHNLLPAEAEAWRGEARRRGEEAARASATWCADGNSDPEAIARLLRMLGDGDPEAEAYMPARPNLSGEFADDPTPLSLARDITGQDDPSADLLDAIADAYEEGVSEVFETACEEELRKHLPEPEEGSEVDDSAMSCPTCGEADPNLCECPSDEAEEVSATCAGTCGRSVAMHPDSDAAHASAVVCDDCQSDRAVDGLPASGTVRVLRMRGTIDDDGSGGSEWFPSEVDDDGKPVPYDDTTTQVENTAEAARLVLDAGCSEVDSAPSFYDPDGSRVVNYRTGEREEVSAHLDGFTPDQLEDIATRVAEGRR